MTDGIELATTWVRIVPTADGITDGLLKTLVPPAEDAGEKAGKGFGSRMKAAVGAAAIGAGIAAGFAGLYQIGAVFDDVTDTIRVGTGLQGDALDGLVDIAKNVGTRVPAEFEKIGPTVSDLNTRLGLSGDTLETVASQYLEAGRILGEDVDINGTTAAFSAFKIEGDEVAGAMDTLFQVSQATGVGLNDLAAGAQSVAPAMQTLGFSFEDTVAMVGSFDKAGLNANAVMASMSKGMVALARDGEQPAEAYQRVVGELQSFVDAGDKASALDLASQVFGTRGAAQFVGALESGVLNMNDLMAATGATGDTILGVGEETMDFAERWQVTMNTAMVAIEPLASAVFAALGDGLAWAMPGLQALGAWVSENTEAIGVIAAVIGTTLVAAFIAWTASIWASTVALLANPVTWIVLAIVALIAGLVLLVANWDNVVAFVTDIWSGFIAWITSVVDGFVGWWNGVWAAVGAWIASVWNGIVSGVQGAWYALASWVVGAVVGFVGWWNSIWGTVGDVIGRVFGGIGSFIAGVWQGIVNGIRGYINTIIRLINGVIDGVNVLVGAAGSVIGLDIAIPKIPMLATGGTITRAGAVIVGENGPELLRLPRGASVDPDISGADGDGDSYYFYGQYAMTAEEIEEVIQKRKRRRTGRRGAVRTAVVT